MSDTETRTDQEILDDATVTADTAPNKVEQIVLTKERLLRFCDDLDKECDDMVGSSGYHTSVRLAVRMIASAIREEFLR